MSDPNSAESDVVATPQDKPQHCKGNSNILVYHSSSSFSSDKTDFPTPLQSALTSIDYISILRTRDPRAISTLQTHIFPFLIRRETGLTHRDVRDLLPFNINPLDLILKTIAANIAHHYTWDRISDTELKAIKHVALTQAQYEWEASRVNRVIREIDEEIERVKCVVTVRISVPRKISGYRSLAFEVGDIVVKIGLLI
ncbi:hypothetical protein M011DRAFT_478237 [Sporormia fimetaria CBS 119925]|uniref:Uncharacterized protein n=1 Tax=Sporormia fimetaria CBS 119925 TaxID=1340428 RepID=A0A6A6V9N9_9PLEO|nr:hypothetical protein M011DRAFT_478237 [Sporormia fimetaria CBS 119925]